jgi:hypothetical protein
MTQAEAAQHEDEDCDHMAGEGEEVEFNMDEFLKQGGIDFEE